MAKNKFPFKLPPFKIESLSASCSETIDWGLRGFNIPDVWVDSSGKDVKVAVLDTGAAPSHPDLVGQILNAKDFTGSPSGAYDTNGHGTHCAGIIAGNKNNSGIIGVAPEARLLVGKVLSDDGYGSSDWIAKGIRWAVSEGADIISMSLGAPSLEKSIREAVKYAYSNGCFIVAAAGNEGPGPNTTGYPAGMRECISVAAVDRKNMAALFSSRGKVDIAAPGVDVTSCWPPKGYAKLSGTSMATPFVSGVLALVLSALKIEGIKYKKLLSEITSTFFKTAGEAGAEGYDPTYGWGLINPKSALREAKKLTNRSKSKHIGKAESVTLSAKDFTEDGLEKLISFVKKLCDNSNP
jgi:subtilisin